MRFIYRARDKQGNIKTGAVEAASLNTAVRILQSYDLIVLDISPQQRITFLDAIFGSKTRISRKNLAVFLRQFSTLISSQVPLTEALRTLILQTTNPGVRDLIIDLMTDLDAGIPLSKSIEKRSDIFGDFYSQMIKSGEISGRLDEVFSYLADYLEHENDLINKAKSAATYPVFLLSAFILLGTIITASLAPQMIQIFEEFNQKPPLGTKILIAVGTFLKDWGILLFVFLLGLSWLLINYFRSPEGRRMSGIYILKVPILGDIYKKIFISRFTETTSTLILGGIPAVTAFEVAGSATGNYVYQKIGVALVEEIKTGESVSNVLKKYYEYFPPLVSQMAAVGENTGRLD